MSDPILPLAVWQEGTLQNDVPANDNSLRIEVITRGAIDVENSPPTTVDGDVYVVGPAPSGAFSTFDEDDVAIYYSGNWYAWAPVDGLRLPIAGVMMLFDGGAWTPDPSGSGVVQSVVAGTGVTVDSTDPANPIVSATGAGGSDNATLTAPPTTGWSWVNQGGATTSNSADYVRIEGGAAGSGAQIRGLFRSIPSTPYTVTAALRVTRVDKNYQSGGIALRNSSGGQIVCFADLSTTSRVLQCAKFNSPTSFNADYRALGVGFGDLVWLRIQDDSTNRKFYFSRNGFQWLEYFSVGRTDFITPDQVGFMMSCENSATPNFAPIVDLVSWAVT